MRQANWTKVGAVAAVVAIPIALASLAVAVLTFLSTGSVSLVHLPHALKIPTWLVFLAVAAIGVLSILLALTYASLRRRASIPSPDEDGLIRVDGRPVCAECLREKGMAYSLKQRRTARVGRVDASGQSFMTPSHPKPEWECSVCNTVYNQHKPGV